MKLFCTVFLIFIIQISYSQGIQLAQPDAAHKYNVKEVIDYVYMAEKNTDKIDTSEKPAITDYKFKNDRLDSVIEYDKFNKIATLYTHRYNEKGQLVERDGFEKGNAFFEKSVYEYDAKGNKIQLDYYLYRTMTFEFKTEYMYGASGKKIEQDAVNVGANLTSKTIFKYDTNGVETEEDFLSGDKLQFKHLMTFDKNGNFLTYDQLNPDDQWQWKSTYTHTNLDENNNWRSSTYLFKNRLLTDDYLIYKITKRKIIYGL